VKYSIIYTSADNGTLLAFAAERRAAAPTADVIDITCRLGPQQQTRRSDIKRSINETLADLDFFRVGDFGNASERSDRALRGSGLEEGHKTTSK